MVSSKYQQPLIMLTHWFPGDFVVDFSPSALVVQILLQFLILIQMQLQMQLLIQRSS